MSEVPSLYDAIQASSGCDRQQRLEELRQMLAASSSPATDTILLGLHHPSSDIRKVVLDALAASSHSIVEATTLIRPVLDILRQSLRASNTSLSAIRTASSALKALSSLYKGDGKGSSCPLTPLEMQSLIEVTLVAMAWGLAALPVNREQKNSDRQWRSGPGSALGFELRESQGSSWRGARVQPSLPTPLGRKDSAASLINLISEASTTTTNNVAGSETDFSAASDGDDDENGEKRLKKLREARRGVRYRSIGCLSVLVEKYSRLLLIHWPRLLLEPEGSGSKAASLMDVAERDESLSNRIAAVHTVQNVLTMGSQAGFMAGAEERSRLSAFTSLSSRIATTIVGLRSRLLKVLTDASTPPSLLEATLKCTRILVVATPQVKLRTSHSQVLRQATLQLCSRPEVSSAVPAYALLSVLVASDGEGGRDSLPGDSIIATISDAKTPLQVRVEAWNTLKALAEKSAIGSEDKERIPRLLQAAVSSNSPLELRQSAARFVQVCLSNDSMKVEETTIDQLIKDASAIVRSIAANCVLSDDQLITLMNDKDGTVRASAVRAVGVKIQSKCRAVLEEEVCRLTRDESLLVRMRASWALGNLCEVSDRLADLLQQCHALKNDDERVTVNAVRGVGALLARCPVTTIQQCQELVESILHWLFSALSKGGPKMRWNVSACLARALTISATSKLLSSLKQHRLALVLAGVLVEDDSFKVRLSAVQALLTLAARNDLGSSEVTVTVAEAAKKALDKVGDQISRATFKEAQMHAIPLQQSLGELYRLLQLDDNP